MYTEISHFFLLHVIFFANTFILWVISLRALLMWLRNRPVLARRVRPYLAPWRANGRREASSRGDHRLPMAAIRWSLGTPTRGAWVDTSLPMATIFDPAYRPPSALHPWQTPGRPEPFQYSSGTSSLRTGAICPMPRPQSQLAQREGRASCSLGTPTNEAAKRQTVVYPGPCCGGDGGASIYWGAHIGPSPVGPMGGAKLKARQGARDTRNSFLVTIRKQKNKNYLLSIISIYFLILTSCFFGTISNYVCSEFIIYNIFTNSTADVPLFYKISATWSNHEGSLLLWCWLLSFSTFLFCISISITKFVRSPLGSTGKASWSNGSKGAHNMKYPQKDYPVWNPMVAIPGQTKQHSKREASKRCHCTLKSTSEFLKRLPGPLGPDWRRNESHATASAIVRPGPGLASCSLGRTSARLAYPPRPRRSPLYRSTTSLQFSKEQQQHFTITAIFSASLILIFFTTFTVTTSNPFIKISIPCIKSLAELNPILQDPVLAIHPPCIYLGYVASAIAFSLCMSNFQHEGPLGPIGGRKRFRPEVASC